MLDCSPAPTSPRGRCILCLQPGQALTLEHVFPDATGGRITARILCQSCNSRLGQYVDAPFIKLKHVEMARATHRMAGRNRKVPQPFSDTYTFDGPDSTLTFQLDENFVPRTVRQAPKVWVDEDGAIGLEAAVDVQDRPRLPVIIRTAMTRFFKNEGQALGWSPEKQDHMIQRHIDQAMQTEIRVTHISTTLHGRWSFDLCALYAELVKVIYEIAYLEFGVDFLDTMAAGRLRTFLMAQCADSPAPWTLPEMEQHLQLRLVKLPDELDALTQFLCRNDRSNYHLAIVTSTHVLCTMLNASAVFLDADIARLCKPQDHQRLYINHIIGDDYGVFSLGEAIARVAPGTIGP